MQSSLLHGGVELALRQPVADGRGLDQLDVLLKPLRGVFLGSLAGLAGRLRVVTGLLVPGLRPDAAGAGDLAAAAAALGLRASR